MHDILYSLIAAKLMVSISYDGRAYIISKKEEADDFFSMMMHDIASQQKWGIRWAYHHAARRNYLAVAVGGDDSVTHTHLDR